MAVSSSNQAKKRTASGAERAATAQLDKAGDAGSARLSKLAGKVGNDEIQARLAQGNASRDEMLQFLTKRLGTLREVQMRELAITNNESQRDWWKEVGDSHKDDYSKPDPTRWGESARLYEEAATQLCRGSLDQGRQLLQRAVAEEKKQFASLTKLVNVDDVEKNAEDKQPAVMEQVTANQACGSCPLPEDIRIAHDIQEVSKELDDPPVKKRVLDPWWTEEEEEEEEGQADGGG